MRRGPVEPLDFEYGDGTHRWWPGPAGAQDVTARLAGDGNYLHVLGVSASGAVYSQESDEYRWDCKCMSLGPQDRYEDTSADLEDG